MVILLPNYNALLDVVKQTSVNANKSQKPVSVYFGKVTNTSPLKILVEQKITLSEAQLVRTKAVESLTQNDGVVLLSMQGGQRFVVIDKVV